MSRCFHSTVFLVSLTILLVSGCGEKKDTNTLTLRIGSGHTESVAYLEMVEKFFLPELERRVKEDAGINLNIVRAYSGSVVKPNETLEGVQKGFVDFGAYCFCFEPSKLPLHAFQAMLPFGPSSPVQSMHMARQVYRQEPFLREVFEAQYGQKLVGLIATETYDLGTSFPWNNVEELQGHKIAGAGLNLKWLEFVHATPVQNSLAEAYISLETNVYEGWIMLPQPWLSLKLYEPAPYFKQVHFGSISWNGLTISLNTWNKLPEKVQIIIEDVGRELEDKSAAYAADAYESNLKALEKAGAQVSELDEESRKRWAESLKHWPQEKALELDSAGLPASAVLRLGMAAAEQQGYIWPVRYHIR